MKRTIKKKRVIPSRRWLKIATKMNDDLNREQTIAERLEMENKFWEDVIRCGGYKT